MKFIFALTDMSSMISNFYSLSNNLNFLNILSVFYLSSSYSDWGTNFICSKYFLAFYKSPWIKLLKQRATKSTKSRRSWRWKNFLNSVWLLVIIVFWFSFTKRISLFCGWDLPVSKNYWIAGFLNSKFTNGSGFYNCKQSIWILIRIINTFSCSFILSNKYKFLFNFSK